MLGLCQSMGFRKSTERWPPSLPQRENEHETWTAFLLAEAVIPAWVAKSFPLGGASGRLCADGTVNLIGSGRDRAHEGRSHEGLCPSGHAGDRGPGLEGLGPGGSILAGGAVIAAEVEEVGNLIVSGEEALNLTG